MKKGPTHQNFDNKCTDAEFQDNQARLLIFAARLENKPLSQDEANHIITSTLLMTAEYARRGRPTAWALSDAFFEALVQTSESAWSAIPITDTQEENIQKFLAMPFDSRES